jgi:hypothetical protein
VCGWSRGLGRGGSRTRGGEPDRGLVAQRAVWPLGVVYRVGDRKTSALDSHDQARAVAVRLDVDARALEQREPDVAQRR